MRRPYYTGFLVCLCGMAAYAATLALVVAMSGSLMALEHQASVLHNRVVEYYAAGTARKQQPTATSDSHGNRPSIASTRIVIEWPPKVASAR